MRALLKYKKVINISLPIESLTILSFYTWKKTEKEKRLTLIENVEQ